MGFQLCKGSRLWTLPAAERPSIIERKKRKSANPDKYFQ
ncbi:unnamed protein product [Linum tenue]|uniref:Uncharacterized protein n=1 Tax=Linum tenue TaxID=586396 RepID=A0AAV0NTW7_9ROSI|nr:unnamed protein product [Linum tenue]